VGAWAESHEAVEAALARAALIFAMTARDRSALERRQPAGQRIVDLPPFLDSDGAPPRSPHDGAGGPVRLLAVAMMRPGDKLESYRLLAASLALLGDRDWTLTIVGDGTAHREVQALFEPFGARIRKTGRIEERAALDQLYADSDLLVWPAVNEAYGMVLLEAQAMGCPVLAGNFGGVSGVMVPGRTGLMPAAGDAAAFARDLAALIDDAPRRRAMGEAAFDFVRRERSLDRAAHILRVTLAGLVPDLRAA
jgi:glycosyltransferase involved in cell wall biosynthesis